MIHSTRIFKAVAVLSMCLPFAAQAVPIVAIGNGPDINDGTYINAGSLANTMAFTSVTILADQTISVVEPIDLSTSVFGPTLFDLFMQAPTVNVEGDVVMGAGNVYFNSAVINLDGTLSADGNDLDHTRLSSMATTINVGGTASALQALSLGYANSSQAVAVNIFGGQFAGEYAYVYNNVHLSMSGGTIEGVQIGATVFDWYGGQILSGGLFSFFGGTMNVYGSDFQIAPYGTCGFINESSWVAAPLQLNNAGGCVRGQLADGSSFETQYNISGQLNFIQAAVVPVPAAAWLFATGLAGLLSVARRRLG